MTPLCALAQKHGTDKCDKHGFTPVYYEKFKDRKVSRLLEVGIKRGASLRMWEEFFPDAEIFGIDHNPAALFNAGRIKSLFADQKDPASLVDVAKKAGGNFDLIIDDGSHHWSLQLSTALALLPFLSDHGLYVIEDVMMRVRKDVRVDDPKFIRNRLPSGYATKVVRTGEGDDDVLLLIWRTA